MEKKSKRMRAFRIHALIAIAALALEFALGMHTALFVEFPETLAKGNAWLWSMQESFVTMAHVVLGTLLMAISFSALGFGIAARSRAAIVSSALGLAMVGLSYMSGAVFLSNIAKDAYSFSMALGFLGAIVAYGLAFYFTRSSISSESS